MLASVTQGLPPLQRDHHMPIAIPRMGDAEPMQGRVTCSQGHRVEGNLDVQGYPAVRRRLAVVTHVVRPETGRQPDPGERAARRRSPGAPKARKPPPESLSLKPSITVAI